MTTYIASFFTEWFHIRTVIINGNAYLKKLRENLRSYQEFQSLERILQWTGNVNDNWLALWKTRASRSFKLPSLSGWALPVYIVRKYQLIACFRYVEICLLILFNDEWQQKPLTISFRIYSFALIVFNLGQNW